MSTPSDAIGHLLWLPLLVPALHVYEWLKTAPWASINVDVDGARAAGEKVASAAIQAATEWSPSSLLIWATAAGTVVLASRVALRARRTERDRSASSGIGRNV